MSPTNKGRRNPRVITDKRILVTRGKSYRADGLVEMGDAQYDIEANPEGGILSLSYYEFGDGTKLQEYIERNRRDLATQGIKKYFGENGTSIILIADWKIRTQEQASVITAALKKYEGRIGLEEEEIAWRR